MLDDFVRRSITKRAIGRAVYQWLDQTGVRDHVDAGDIEVLIVSLVDVLENANALVKLAEQANKTRDRR